MALASLLVGLGAVATLCGADDERAPSNPREDAGRLIQETYSRGSDDPDVRAGFVSLRHRVAAHPLDANARSAYATALVVLAGSHDELDAAAFHARTAARYAPVTVPVVRRAAIVLAQTGATSEAIRLTHQMFEYDPPAAARLLAVLEPLLAIDAARKAVPATPEAWLARIRQLRRDGRGDEASALLDVAVERWPQDLWVRALAAEKALVSKDWVRLSHLLPSDEVFPDTGESAILYLHRCRSRAALNDPAGAEADLSKAISIGGHRPWLLIMAGDAWIALSRPDNAKEVWTQALRATPTDSIELRGESLRRLARLAERRGQGGTALRIWRDLLDLIPEDREASGRIKQLKIDR